jgi:hypothetical protein
LSGSEPQQRRSDPKRVSSVSTPILNHKSDSGETAKFQADPQPKGNGSSTFQMEFRMDK